GTEFMSPTYSGTSYASTADYAAAKPTSTFIAQTVSPTQSMRWNCNSVASCMDATQASFQTVKLNSATVADLNLPVTTVGSNNAPATPTVTCAATALTNADFPVSFVTTDSDGDGVAYEVDPNYISPTFNPVSVIPVTGYAASGSPQSLNVDLNSA